MSEYQDLPAEDYQQGPFDDAWKAWRAEIHEKYIEEAGLNDSSRLGYLHGERKKWTEDDVVEMWREAAHDAGRRKDAVNHVYVHVPFCKSICNFCNYERLKPSNAEGLSKFSDRVFNSLHRIGPVVQPLKWHTLYIGGGTASTLPAPMLKKILTGIDETLRWHPNSTRFFEFDPAVFNDRKLNVLLEHGFEHFSFGVQTLDASVNEAHNRGPQSRDLIKRRFSELREGGIFNISCDFLLGLAGTTPEQMVREIEEVLALAPRWVDLYYLTPTQDYMNTHFGGKYEAFWKHIKPFHEKIPELVREAAKRSGFRVRRGHGHNIIVYRQMGPHERNKNKRGGIFSYTQLVDQQRRPLHLLGLGTSARSLVFCKSAIECRPPDDGSDDGAHHYVGQQYGVEGEVRLFLSHILRDNDVIDRAMFRRIFSIDVLDAIPRTLAVWKEQGIITVTDDEVRLARQERRDRMRALLWAVPDANLGFEVDRYEANRAAQARKKEHHQRNKGKSRTDASPSSAK